jgi:Ca2+-binding RTX toxin-like protein
LADGVYFIHAEVFDVAGNHRGTTIFNNGEEIAVTLDTTPPQITSNGGGAAAIILVAENTTSVTTVTATPSLSQILGYSIVPAASGGGGDAAMFSIDATTGALAFLTAPDYERPTDSSRDNVYNVTVQVSDGSRFDTQAIAITVTNTSPESLIGDSGNNTFVASADIEFFIGGSGQDTVSYAEADVGLRANLSNPSTNTGFAAGDHYSSIENLIGSAFNDKLTGDAGANVLEGGAGADQLSGGNGIDTASYAHATEALTANLAAPSINTGFAAGDTYVSIESLIGSAFDDKLSGDANNNVLEGGAGKDQLNGGQGVDTASYEHAAGAVIADLSKPKANTGEAAGDVYKSIENLTGSSFNDQLVGDGSDNVLSGGDGQDTLIGNGGGDTLKGGAGDDTLDGGAGADGLYGGDGNDVLGAGAGKDTLVGGADNDALDGGAGDDDLEGGDGNDRLDAGAGKDTLSGGSGDDILNGDAGDDILIGGLGADSLDGGAGKDQFVQLSFDEGVDSIHDFNVKQDTLVFSASGFGGGLQEGVSLVAGSTFIASATPVAATASGAFLYDTDDHNLYWDADGSGAAAAQQVIHFDHGVALTADQFTIMA